MIHELAAALMWACAVSLRLCFVAKGCGVTRRHGRSMPRCLNAWHKWEQVCLSFEASNHTLEVSGALARGRVAIGRELGWGECRARAERWEAWCQTSHAWLPASSRPSNLTSPVEACQTRTKIQRPARSRRSGQFQMHCSAVCAWRGLVCIELERAGGQRAVYEGRTQGQVGLVKTTRCRFAKGSRGLLCFSESCRRLATRSG